MPNHACWRGYGHQSTAPILILSIGAMPTTRQGLPFRFKGLGARGAGSFYNGEGTREIRNFDSKLATQSISAASPELRVSSENFEFASPFANPTWPSSL